MYLRKIILHEKLHLLISCKCTKLVKDRKSKSLVYCILRNTANLQLNSISYTVSELSVCVIRWINQRICWVQVRRIARC